jgi:hypothetical protein
LWSVISISFLLPPLLHLVLCNYVLDSWQFVLVGGFIHLFSLPWFNFCAVTDLDVS